MPESKRFLLRLNPHLFEALRRWAEDDLRSINSQIEYLLTEQARRAGRLPRQNQHRHLPGTGSAPGPPADSETDDDATADGDAGTDELNDPGAATVSRG